MANDRVKEAVQKFMSAKKLTPMRAIRAKCLECSGSSAEVKACPCKSCPIWKFRSGHRPVE